MYPSTRIVSATVFILVGLYVMFCSNLLEAQSIRPGFQVGAAYTSTDYDETLDLWQSVSGRFNPNGRVFVAFEVSRAFSAEIGIGFWRFGNQVDLLGDVFSGVPGEDTLVFEKNGIKGEFEINSSFIGVPILGRFYVTDDRRFNVFGGVDFRYLIDAESDLRQDAVEVLNVPATRQKSDLTEDLRRFDVALSGGFGYALPLARHTFFADVHFSRGLIESRSSFGWWSQQAGISVGMKF